MSVSMISNDISVGCSAGNITDISHFGVYARNSEADQRGLCSTDV